MARPYKARRICSVPAIDTFGPLNQEMDSAVELTLEEYETIHLQSLFRERNLMTTLDQELLHESVRQVTYIDGVVSVLLKNKQLLKGGPVR